MASVARRYAIAQLLAYLLIVAVAVLGFSTFERRQEALAREQAILSAQEARICETARINRASLRNLTIAITMLGEDLVLDGKPRSSADPEERLSLARLEAFRITQLATLTGRSC